MCKVLFMKTSIQLRNKRQSFYNRSVKFEKALLTVLPDYK